MLVQPPRSARAPHLQAWLIARGLESVQGSLTARNMRLDKKIFASTRFVQTANALLCVLLITVYLSSIADSAATRHDISKRNYSDQSVKGYLAERTCWWNEVCKEEFHSKFRCRCPKWSYCRAPGQYYDAYCSITRTTGYIWIQPETSISLGSSDPPAEK